MVPHEERIHSVLKAFNLPGKMLDVSPYKSGHINETYVSRWSMPHGEIAQYIHQWINHEVFRDVPALMNNIAVVTRHMAKSIKAGSRQRTLEIIPTTSGALYFQDPNGEFWRTYVFIEGTASFGVCTGLAQACEAALTLGRFQCALSDLSPNNLVDTIPFFLHTPRRYEAFERVVASDRMQRVAKVRREIEFALARRADGSSIVDGIAKGTLPVRVTHNDVKLNNVLFDEKSGEGVAIVDLDTVMGGSVLYDFGDLVRNVSIPAAEDEIDLTKVEMSLEYFEAIAKGYGQAMRGALCPAEVDLLAVAPRIMALTLGIRFLTDYLDGDHYFKIHRPLHNLDRARAQFKIVESMERQESAMRAIAERELLVSAPKRANGH